MTDNTETEEFGNSLTVIQYMHCVQCMEELPEDKSPQEWADLSVGFTKWGLQVWCNRHEANILHVDFEGIKHKADTTRKIEKGKDDGSLH